MGTTTECVVSSCNDAVTRLGYIDYACEHDDVGRAAYLVTDHAGHVSHCFYCEDCAALARCDWNGETAAIEAAS